MASLSEDDLIHAVTTNIRRNRSYASRVESAIASGNNDLFGRLLEEAVRVIFGIIVDLTNRLINRVKEWLGW